MRRTIKYIISFIFILIVTCSGLLCSAAIFEKTLDSEQMALIVTNNSRTNTQGTWAYLNFTTSAGVTYYTVGNVSSNSQPLLSNKNSVYNFPLFLSGFESITVQFAIFRNEYPYMSIVNVKSVTGSSAPTVAYEQIGSTGTDTMPMPGGSGTANYYGKQYQVTITGPSIDYLRITVDYDGSYDDDYMVGLIGIQVNATSEALQNIDQQVSQIGSKVDSLTSAVQNAASNIGAIVDGQGNLLTAVEDIKDYAESIDDKQDIIIYATENDQLVIQEYNERLTDIKNEFNQYNSILEQYYNAPDVNNVTSIIDGGMPSEYDPTVVAPVLSAIFDNSIVTIILVAVLALVLMSYVLFGKKG